MITDEAEGIDDRDARRQAVARHFAGLIHRDANKAATAALATSLWTILDDRPTAFATRPRLTGSGQLHCLPPRTG